MKWSDHVVFHLACVCVYCSFKFNISPEEFPVGIGAHTDFEVITLLWQDDDPPGLEIHWQDEWHQVQPKPGHFVVNVGDLLARWTDSRYNSNVYTDYIF